MLTYEQKIEPILTWFDSAMDVAVSVFQKECNSIRDEWCQREGISPIHSSAWHAMIFCPESRKRYLRNNVLADLFRENCRTLRDSVVRHFA